MPSASDEGGVVRLMFRIWNASTKPLLPPPPPPTPSILSCVPFLLFYFYLLLPQIGFGMGYLQLEEIMAKKPDAALPVSAIKLLVVATASMGMFELSPLLHTAGGGDAGGLADALSNLSLQIPDFGAILSSPLALGGILYTGLITTALALWIESIAFARVPATDTSIILTTEPIFAAAGVFGGWWRREKARRTAAVLRRGS